MRMNRQSLRLKEAVIASFWEPAPSLRARFTEFSTSDWKRVLPWLDVSGLALYLFDRISSLQLQDSIPSPILWRLRKNLADNRARTDSLFNEAVEICTALRQQNIACALLKGITLPPESVPDSTLRCQADLDILVREPDAAKAQECLAAFGYELDVRSGMTWEFKAGPTGTLGVEDIYRARRDRALDLHLLVARNHESSQTCSDRLDRVEFRSIQRVPLPVFSSADIFVQQAVHLFKHMCGEATRAFWVLEFWRHITARRNDETFWVDVKRIAALEPQADQTIGAAVLLTSLVFGPCAPPQLACWSLDRLSPAVCLWIQMYGRRILLSDSPRSKLYLLLRRHLQPDSASERAARRRLMFPIHLPPSVTRPAADEHVAVRFMRYRTQLRFMMIRLGFHLAEGFRLAFESIRWQRRLTEVAQ
jgi:hypothetical protein